MLKPLIDYFPTGFSPNETQAKLIPLIEKAFKTKKFVILSAATGAGKSHISKTIGNSSKTASAEFKQQVNSYAAYKQDYSGEYLNKEACVSEGAFGTFALTITKTLQDQYKDLFNDTGVIKGKSNYVCKVDEDYDVDTAPCIFVSKLKDECWAAHKCLYYNARNEAVTAQFASLNYKMFMALPDHVKQKEYIICDEASELEDELVKQFSGEINYKKLKMCGVELDQCSSSEYARVGAFVGDILVAIQNQVEEITTKVGKKKAHQNDLIKLRYLKNLHNSLKTVHSLWSACEFIIDRDKDGVRVQPLRVDQLSRFIFDNATKVLLMSATIIDHEAYAKSLGIRKCEYEFIETPSIFDPSKAPIYISNKYKLNHQNLQTSLPKLVKDIELLCQHHKNEKGVIHTHTQSIADFIKVHLGKDKRFLFREEGTSNEDILKEHFETDHPTVLVSPSLQMGVSLDDDLARFAIVCKTPYLPLGDQRIKRLFDADGNWYRNKALKNLIQICGRGIRSKEDSCKTYILDANVSRLILDAKDILPEYFKQRFH